MRRLGSSALEVTEACLGTMTFGVQNSEADAHEQLDYAIKTRGVNFVDTAELYPVAFNYGKTTEKWIGNWLASREAKGTVKRSDLYLATKCNGSRIGGFPDSETRPDNFCYSFADADMAALREFLAGGGRATMCVCAARAVARGVGFRPFLRTMGPDCISRRWP